MARITPPLDRWPLPRPRPILRTAARFVASVMVLWVVSVPRAQAAPNEAVSQTERTFVKLLEREPVWENSGSQTWTWKEDTDARTSTPSDNTGQSGEEGWKPWRHDWTIRAVEGAVSTPEFQAASWGDENNGLVLGTAQAGASGSVGLENHGVDFLGLGLRAKGKASASVDLVDARAGGETVLGTEERGLGLGLKTRARVGLHAKVSGDLQVDRHAAGVSAKAEAFAGAKATGAIPVTVMLCGLSTTLAATGEVSAGAGAHAKLEARFDWSRLTLKLDAGAAATLGLGAGLGGKVKVDAGALVNDPGSVAKCLREQLEALLRLSLEGGGWLVEQAHKAAPILKGFLRPPLEEAVRVLEEVLCGPLGSGC